jgi:hypothetical protein
MSSAPLILKVIDLVGADLHLSISHRPEVGRSDRRIDMKAIMLGLSVVLLATGASAQTKMSDATALKNYRTAERIAQQNLRTFDTLDYDVFSNQQWDRLKESHAKDIIVYWPDGRVARDVDKHIDDLKYMFTYAPDTRIKQHPVKLGQGEWTTVIGVVEGTFTKPMMTPDGKVIQPTGTSFKLPMATVGHWKKDGMMSEEYLFWDTQSYMPQLGIVG